MIVRKNLFTIILIFAAGIYQDSYAGQIDPCDMLAAHPEDPNRVSDGFPDGEINTNQAITRCEEAVEAEPNSGRFWFQLARAYWQADVNDQAITAFKKAALDLDYGPAYAYLGVAYEYGYVSGEPQESIARALYTIAIESGFEPAQTMLEALPLPQPLDDPLGEDRIDFTGYYQPVFLDAIFTRNFSSLNRDALKVLRYLQGMYGFFSTEVNWHDLSCSYLHDTRLTQKVMKGIVGMDGGSAGAGLNAQRGFEKLEGYFQQRMSEGLMGALGAMIDIMDLNSIQQEGKRDGGHLAIEHTCESDVVKKLYKNAQYFFLAEMSFSE